MRAPAITFVLLVAGSQALAGCHMGLLGLVGGASSADGRYVPGTLAAELGPASVRTLGCLDLAFAITGRSGGPELLEAYVGNRCVRSEALDLQKLAIRAVDSTGESRSVFLVDPRHEIVRLRVGGEERGHERIRLEGTAALQHLCLHLDAIAPDAAEARPAALCFQRRSEGWRPTS